MGNKFQERGGPWGRKALGHTSVEGNEYRGGSTRESEEKAGGVGDSAH